MAKEAVYGGFNCFATKRSKLRLFVQVSDSTYDTFEPRLAIAAFDVVDVTHGSPKSLNHSGELSLRDGSGDPGKSSFVKLRLFSLSQHDQFYLRGGE